MSRGRVYRRCACRDEQGQQLGTRCPELAASGRHGTWGYAIDVPTPEGTKRKTMRRGGFTSKALAQKALGEVRDRYGAGIEVDDRTTVAGYLAEWLVDKRRTLKPKTWHSYSEYVTKELTPALGGHRLERLRHDHIRRFIVELEAAGRGAPTIRRIIGVLSSALADAVKRRRLTHNPAQHAALPPEGRVERTPWSATEAVTFLDHVRDDRLGELYEVLIGCGLRRGEALALRWVDIDLERRTLVVRRTLSDVNGHLMFTTPKTKGSAAGVGLSSRVVAALTRQRARQDVERADWAEAYEDEGLVFARENGRPIRPEYVTARFLVLAEQAGLPRVRLHDLRHLAATLMLANGVPLALVSKTLRHAKTAITADLYSHLSPETATAAADALGAALDAAAAERTAELAAHRATTTRPLSAADVPPEGAREVVTAGQGGASSPH